MRKSILLVEDDPLNTELVTELLEGFGYAVVQASSAAETLVAVSKGQPDLILLDLGLPDADGLVFLPKLRGLTPRPIVILSARCGSNATVAFKLGADDFITKPFDLDELEARISAVLRRDQRNRAVEAAQPLDDLRVGDLTVSHRRGVCLLAETPLHLTTTEFKLLAVLASAPDVVITREELLERVWNYTPESRDMAGYHLLDVHMWRLRVKLRPARAYGIFVQTVRAQGYRLTSPAPVG